jgi:DNA ligase-1
LNQELVIGKPVKVMLALKVNDAEEGIKRVGQPLEAEFKLDGFRIQAHKTKDKIRLFTRRLEDVTLQFPDIVSFVKENVKADSFILDSEAVGYSPKTKKYLPFQKISQRIRRKYNIEEMAEKFPVELNVFDILYYDGKNMLKEPFKKRRDILENIVKEKKKQIVLVKKLLTSDAKEINKFFKESIAAGNEGLMLKNLDSPYKPGARVGYMVKLKETMENLDLVIVGAEWGEGKRARWLSSYVLACRDEDGNLLEIGRVSTGLKEKDEEGLSFNEMTKMLQPLVISAKGKEVKVKPEIIIEVAYEEIQKSPKYSSGFALRFPRVIRLRTDERNVEDISSLEYVEELYYGQKK